MAMAVAAKRKLRGELRRALDSLTSRQIQDESAALTGKFLGSDEYQKSKRVSIYLSMPTEVNTHMILEDVFKSEKECFIPRFEGRDMEMLKVHSMADISSLPHTQWDIQQPATLEGRENPLTSGSGLDLILIPGLGFTETGLRIGRGKGFYDGYIAKCVAAGYRPQLLSLAFSCQRCTNIPTSDHDITIDRVIFSDSQN